MIDKRDVQAFFDRLAPDWDAGMVRNEAVIARILDNAGVCEGCTVLDVACGTGVLFGDYVTRGAARVTADDLPPEMAAHIRGAEVILGQATVPRCHCASISYGDTMEITFAGTQAETDTERDFFRFLVREGIPVRVESNR